MIVMVAVCRTMLSRLFAVQEAVVAQRDREEQEDHDEADVDDVAAPVEIGERVLPLCGLLWTEAWRSGSWVRLLGRRAGGILHRECRPIDFLLDRTAPQHKNAIADREELG